MNAVLGLHGALDKAGAANIEITLQKMYSVTQKSATQKELKGATFSLPRAHTPRGLRQACRTVSRHPFGHFSA